MIEKPTVITGSPESVQKKLAEFLASHPSASVLSSAVTVTQKLDSKGKPAAAATTVCVIAGLKL